MFRKHGYRGATLKALARACGLSIPGLYRYFPSKKAFALFPLVSLYPELHEPPPELARGDPIEILSGWVQAAVDEMPNYILALRLALEVGLEEDERGRLEANLLEHAELLSRLARQAQPRLDEHGGAELAWAMINIATGPALSGIEAQPEGLRHQLHALLRGYEVSIRPGPRLRT